jgi:GDP-4-dehydro-6-deoxy-D-mannose reductase
MRALVTGAGGFVGAKLCEYLLAHTDWEVVGTVYPQPAPAAQPEGRLRLVWADLREPQAVTRLIEETQPEAVFHLAAQAAVAASYEDPWETLETNVRSQLNLLEALRRAPRPATVLVVGSGEEYGAPRPEELPLTEEAPLRPGTPYAVSKVAQDLLGLQYHLSYQLPVIRVRPFNHTGPGQSERFVVPAFAAQVARIAAHMQEPVIYVGNLDAVRDFTDVRDIVRAYHLAVTQGEPGEVYNLASGEPHAIREVLEALVAYAGIHVELKRDPERYRPLDVPVVYGSAEKFRRRTGWRPRIGFAETLRDTLLYWIEQYRDTASLRGG